MQNNKLNSEKNTDPLLDKSILNNSEESEKSKEYDLSNQSDKSLIIHDLPISISDNSDESKKEEKSEDKKEDICHCCSNKKKFTLSYVNFGKVSEIYNKVDFLNILNDAENILIIVDFSAVWCGPCKKIMPEIIKLAEVQSENNVLFLKVDVDNNEETSSYCGISCMPTFQFYKNNIKVHEIQGADINAIKNSIDIYNK